MRSTIGRTELRHRVDGSNLGRELVARMGARGAEILRHRIGEDNQLLAIQTRRRGNRIWFPKGHVRLTMLLDDSGFLDGKLHWPEVGLGGEELNFDLAEALQSWLDAHDVALCAFAALQIVERELMSDAQVCIRGQHCAASHHKLCACL